MAFQPFANDDQSCGLTNQAGELTLENQGEQVNLYGNISFTLDRDSLNLAKALQQTMTEIVQYLEQHDAANIDPASVKQAQQANITEVKNPFG